MSSDARQSLPDASSPTLPDVPPASLSLLYHELTPERTAYAYAMTTQVFQQHLELFQRLWASSTAVVRPEITFDDGHLSNFDQALPLLSSFGITAHFFVTAGWTARRAEYMTWHHLRQMQAAGQRIGAHGWSHKLLTHCSDAELQHELTDARLLLEEKLGVAVTTLSIPGGRFDRRVLSACAKAGYSQVFSSIPRSERSPLAPLVGRVNLRAGVTLPWLASLFEPGSPSLHRLERQYRTKQMAQRALGDRLYFKLWALLNRAEAGETAA